ncbi:MAG: hypothetical protein N2035_05390 [Chthoniobacterales bacterium]|nr:hypothetical protein [Chthoniobacterales bacterium]
MILPNCRAKLTAGDLEFIAKVLNKNSEQKNTIYNLLCDPDCRDCILDDDKIYREIIESSETLQISPNLLFYVLCRKALRGTPADVREVADYLASMLGKFMLISRMSCPEELGEQDLRYICDALRALSQASHEQAFILRAHLANYCLFLSGIFHEYLEKRCRRGGPSLSFYEDVGRSNYAVAAKDQRAKKFGLESIFETLASSFHEVRLGLTELADRILHLDSAPSPPFELACAR